MDIAELDALAHSFHFDECLQRQRLNMILADFTTQAVDKQEVPRYSNNAQLGGLSGDV